MLILSRKQLFRTYQDLIHRQKQYTRWAITCAILIIMVVSFAVPAITRADSSTVVSISVDGEKKVVSTDADTVSDVLSRANIIIGSDDLVEPGLKTKFNNAIFNINVYRAKPMVVIDGQTVVKVNSAYQNPKLVAERSAKINVFPEDGYRTEPIRDFVTQDSIGTKITIERSVPFIIKVDGATLQARTLADNVGKALRERGIVLGPQDQLSVPKDTKITPGLEVNVIRNGRQILAQEEVTPYITDVLYDNNQDVGYELIKREGANGKRLVTYEVLFVNGQPSERKELQSVVMSEQVSRIIVRGSRAKYTPLSDSFASLRQCESGGNYASNTGNGYYGAYQFSLPTWRSMGTGYDRPDIAPPAVQDNAAMALQARSGWGQWPACARKLGLY